MDQQQHHMLAPAIRRETLPPPQPSPQNGTADLGPPPPLPRLFPNAAATSQPPAYSQATLVPFPDVPTTDLPFPRSRPMSHNDGDKTLPSLSSLTSGQSMRGEPAPNQPQWLQLNPLKFPSPTYQTQLPKIESPDTMDLDGSSNSIASATSPDRYIEPRASSVSLDDPDVRLAAEALGDLRADFVSSPPHSSAMLPLSPPGNVLLQTQSPRHPEPLLSLLTTAYPILDTTMKRYGGAKDYSPRFKSSAEYVEGYLTPIANTVGHAGRIVGAEAGVRWWLGSGRRNPSSSDLEAGGSSKKRRKVTNDRESSGSHAAQHEFAIQPTAAQQIAMMSTIALPDSVSPTPKGERRLSLASTVDTLPAYDEQRSPAYTESASQKPEDRNSPAWQSRLIMSTSGLGVAMSDESLRSLKFCLSWLRWANGHISKSIGALKETIDQYDQAGAPQEDRIEETEKGDGTQVTVTEEPPQQSQTELAARIDTLKGDVLKTLQDAITTVSKYAGGALPENARILVRRHLTSLPQRFRIATMSDSATQTDAKDNESVIRDGAHKILVLAKEGLDMVTQVSGVLDGTIVSAEEWCERIGKKANSKDGVEEPILPQTESSGDVKMG